jgi:hypothetical protein
MTPREELPLTNRYHAAWAEYGARVGQRQNVVQIYLTVAGVAFGFYFQRSDAPHMGDFLAVAMSVLTLCCSAMVAMHQRAMGGLAAFLRDCEGAAGVRLAHFSEPGSGRMSGFHRRQSVLDRAVVAAVFGFTNGIALWLTWGGALPVACAVALAVSAALLARSGGGGY